MEIKVDRKAAIKKLKALVLSSKGEVEPFRERLEKKFSNDFIPNRVERQERKIGGIDCDVLVPEVFASNRIMLYIHGGSFVGGSRDSWRTFCSVLANASSSKVIVPEFRLPPSYPFPASIEDSESVMNEILNSNEYSEVIIGADGSGAGIATAVLFRMKDKRRSLVSKLILFSPWLDISPDALSNKKQKDEILGNEDLRHAADFYTYSSNLANILVSPLLATEKDFDGFPEVYMQVGGRELLLNQADRFFDMLECYRIKATLDIVPDMMFMFQMADEFLSESHSAVEKLGNYINRQNGLSDSEIKERRQLMRENNMAVE